MMSRQWAGWSFSVVFCLLPAVLSAQSTEEDDDLIEVTVGTATKTMTRDQFLHSGIVPLQPKTTAEIEIDRLIKSGELTKTPRPYPAGAVSLDSKEIYRWPGGATYTREELKARLDEAVKGLLSGSSDRREAAAGFLGSVWRYTRVRYEPSIEPLKKALSDPSLSARREASEALALLGEMAFARPILLEQCNYTLLAELGEKGMSRLIAQRKDFAFPCRMKAIHYLISFDHSADARALLLRLIADGWALDSHADESGYEGTEYVRALGTIGGTDAERLLDRISREDANEGVREAALKELKRVKSRMKRQ